MSDWQIGDLALCVDDKNPSDAACVGRSGRVALVAGQIYTVTGLPSGGGLLLDAELSHQVRS